MYKTPLFVGFLGYDYARNLQTFIENILIFINGTLVPFILAVAFVFFLWKITQYFIFKGGDEKEHEKARSSALWGIATFVIILSLWGIVNLLADGFDLVHINPITPDYMQQKSGGPTGNSNSISFPTGNTSTGNTGQTFPADNDLNYTLPGQYVTPE